MFEWNQLAKINCNGKNANHITLSCHTSECVGLHMYMQHLSYYLLSNSYRSQAYHRPRVCYKDMQHPEKKNYSGIIIRAWGINMISLSVNRCTYWSQIKCVPLCLFEIKLIACNLEQIPAFVCRTESGITAPDDIVRMFLKAGKLLCRYTIMTSLFRFLGKRLTHYLRCCFLIPSLKTTQ